MGSISDDEECVFFDASENIGQVPDLGSNEPQVLKSSSRIDNCVTSSYQYDVWSRSPSSVRERRREFFSWMGEDLVDVYGSSDSSCESERIMESSEAVVRTSILEDEFPSQQVHLPGLSVGVLGSYKELDSNETFVCRSGNPDGGSECDVHDQAETNHKTMKLERQQLGQQEFEAYGDAGRKLNVVKRSLISRLRSLTCIVNDRGRTNNSKVDSSSAVQRSRVQRTKVHHRKKRLNELSGLFVGQDIQAHEGSILTMKFSLDGQYLASAGEDKIVRVWQVVEDERSDEVDIPDLDPSCMYFTVNHLSQLAPLVTEKERINKLRGLKKTTGSSCVIFPPKVFRILEEPLHVFQGHSGDILDISWSENNYLLSSSTDKTVRLWQVGYDKCLKVFSHSNYVTCVQFNPVNDNYFISGSIDGKVRIWAINSGQVVTWTDLKDIVTAISYRPDGKGGIIGSIEGACCFFSFIDDEIQLEKQICLVSKKKSLCKRITGFQFLPQDPSKVIVTCADSLVRILSGINVIGKYRGLRNAGSHLSAAFSSDGKHIISASEDSNVYLWNCHIPEETSVSQPEAVRSFEFFYSDASIAIPWSGLKNVNHENQCHSQVLSQSLNNFPLGASPCFSLGQGLFLEAIPKGSATWPEEKLPLSSPRFVPSAMCKSQYKFLKSSCQSSSSSHAWGLVIVTAGYDGRIRSYHNYGLPSPL
ncbi:WD repeat-containing protein 44-like [Solanum pennellii]|uniref:WD repeat-containing protein 44-like n=1 Tax=Solanum pennellii TaxID=28526 RepID=A0ABM1GX11_SOLPN|nr:WD repeat-containing protein 44-like [Solanum pennellii]XP_015077181.1 WD repeat-containing protein 44-like [Solanum pennellii]